ncbi:hypothetical protein Nepgr_029330 [Nepenthes gracilis]|uniref:Auxin-responsive protein n=1 Tax=Nepenthes gracilis TaxID=150966 RepID=A0AAD3TDR6_NEPGR|nr:hypothetical protein Nepgr_029330 [Nepenthes gracilis]
MDSNMAEFLMDPLTSNSSIYCPAKDDNNDIIDLGLSLKTMHAGDNHSSHPFAGGYDSLMEWPVKVEDGDEGDGVQSKHRWEYIKVNMDGVPVGRKICVLDQVSYSSLAHQLEDMFGRQTINGLHLFQVGSDYALFYKDIESNWRPAGDVPWKEFADSATRLRIMRKNEAFLLSS